MKTYSFILRLLVIAIIALQTATVNAQNINDKVYQAYLQADVNALAEVVKELSQQADKNNHDQCNQLLHAQYFLLNATLATEDEDTFDDYIDDAVDNAKSLSKKGAYQAEATALLSTMYGFKIAFSPMKGMFLGGEASGLAEKATELDSNEPIAWMKYANNLYNTPEMWGGDKAEALKHYEKAVQLFEQNPALTVKNPHYLDALAWLGIAYKKAGKTADARKVFEKALQAAPEFAWVKNKLLPSVQ